MLRLVEFGLMAVSLLVVVGLVLMSPRGAEAKPAESSETEKGAVVKE
ncbi:MAG TPA: hypothetical protein VE178_11260 [Silvibacterium sp.]|jgi:hypothetical protein|nr:hypothetical protein [Silvibacterium sp.]